MRAAALPPSPAPSPPAAGGIVTCLCCRFTCSYAAYKDGLIELTRSVGGIFRVYDAHCRTVIGAQEFSLVYIVE